VKKLVLVALTVTTAFACVAVALAQTAPTITSTFKITPSKAGTKAKPKNGLVNVVFNVNPESESTLSRIEYTIPKGVKLDGTGFPICTDEYIAANGDEGCPKGSKVGTGAATALLGPQKSTLNFDVEVYAAGPKALTLYLKTSLFTIPIPADIKGQVVSFDIPERVQSPVSGLYSYVTSVTANLGKQSGVTATTKVKGKTRYFASVISCKGGKHSGAVKAFLAANPDPPSVPSISATGTSKCKAPATR
jgi:hypothetical protein